MADNDVAELTAHYRETSELNQRLWEQRNRTFLTLILSIGLGATLLYQLPPPPEGGRPIIFEAVVRLTFPDSEQVRGLATVFPYPILHAVILITVFYMMVVFFHRSATVLRNYSYLALLERDIRQRLNLPDDSVAFTRESSFYWSHRPRMFGLVKYMYVAILGSLLTLFFSYRLIEDIGHLHGARIEYRQALLVAIDIVVAIPTVTIFAAYVMNTLDLESRLATSSPPAERPGLGANDPENGEDK